jgi:glycosyltransferase involved in cell wall biosynthesis
VSSTIRLALRLGLRRAGAVTGCSRFTLRDAESRFGLRDGRGTVIFNDADPALNAPGSDTALPDSLADLNTRRYVAAIGRVVDKKGFDLLLDAFHQISAHHGDVDLVIGGNGPRLDDLRKYAAELGVADRVHFPGRLSRDEVAQVMGAASVFVMPSRLEPFGIVVLEAWRAGTAVIATSIGGPPEFVSDGIDGLLVDPHDTRALAEALDKLLSDDSLRRRVAAAGRVRFSDFVWPALTFEYRRVFASLARSRLARR